MKKIAKYILSATACVTLATSCMQEFEPQSSTVTVNQAGNAPGSYDNFVSGLTSELVGQFFFSSSYPYDHGYPSFFQMRDVQGQDVVINYDGHWYQTWYTCDTGLGPQYLVCQVPWTYYYKWIKACNNVLSMSGENPTGEKKIGAGIAHCMRAMHYMDIARMYAPESYSVNPEAITVPIVTEQSTVADLATNPRATNKVIWDFIISDLDEAEALLDGYERPDVYTPDQSVVYGLKARAYLETKQWENAKKYAKLAQAGYTIMNEDQYTNRDTGFNTPNGSWIFGVKYKEDDPNIKENDADSSWGAWMILEVNGSECGYASNYGSYFNIDRHLYETIPATDFRKKCYVDFAIDDMETLAEVNEALSAYSKYMVGNKNCLLATAENQTGLVGGLPLKFRKAAGDEGYNNQYKAFCVSVPLMRAEEMKLIEIEATGMLNEAEGKTMLIEFAKTRDASFEYGKHDESYYNTTTSAFQNEVWWQRRVELWGEGFATFDIKRLNKGIIRNYENTNHVETYRWNTTTPPNWMTWCFVQTETNYNTSCIQNPTPLRPSSDSEPYKW